MVETLKKALFTFLCLENIRIVLSTQEVATSPGVIAEVTFALIKFPRLYFLR
jgi:hypothetical protein